ncbi:MAG: hypothetical protein GY833_24760 [Aestuariibacter sp.]|nr:hypothetical protein [Aestuariibacter sp.]
MNTSDNILRWYAIFQLVSLESIDSFLPEMGLNFFCSEQLRPIARSFFEQYEKRKRTDDELESRILLEQTFDQIAQKMSPETTHQLHQWGLRQFPYEGSSSRSVFLWKTLLRRLARLGNVTSDLIPIAVPEYKVKIIVQTVQDYLGGYLVLAQRIQELETVSRSDFDERIYQTYEQGTSPLDLLIDTIESYRFRKTWEKINKLLTDDEMEMLLQWGKSQAQQMNIPSGSVVLFSCVQ